MAGEIINGGELIERACAGLLERTRLVAEHRRTGRYTPGARGFKAMALARPATLLEVDAIEIAIGPLVITRPLGP